MQSCANRWSCSPQEPQPRTQYRSARQRAVLRVSSGCHRKMQEDSGGEPAASASVPLPLGARPRVGSAGLPEDMGMDHLGLYCVPPPGYDVALDMGEEGESALEMPPGSALALRPLPVASWSSVTKAVAALEARFPAVSLILWTDLLGNDQSALYATRASRYGIDAVVRRPRLSAAALREQICDPGDLADRVVRWLPAAGVNADPAIASVMRVMVGAAGTRRRLKTVRGAAGGGRWRWQRLFARHGLRTPGSWFRCFRLVHEALWLQAHPEASIEAAADALGYHDAAALRKAFRDRIGITPGGIREIIGWKYVLYQTILRVRS